MESSLYVHIPFCIKKCLYCDFVSFPGREDMHRRYVDTLLSEMALRGGKTLRTVYIGGAPRPAWNPGCCTGCWKGWTVVLIHQIVSKKQ